MKPDEGDRPEPDRTMAGDVHSGAEYLRFKPTPGGGRTPRLHRVCDAFTEALIYLMVIFTPWAFGTTQPWAIRTMNLAAYALGGLLTIKWWIRRRTGFGPARWGSPEAPQPGSLSGRRLSAE